MPKLKPENLGEIKGDAPKNESKVELREIKQESKYENWEKIVSVFWFQQKDVKRLIY